MAGNAGRFLPGKKENRNAESVADVEVAGFAGCLRCAFTGGQHGVQLAALDGLLHAGIVVACDFLNFLHGFLAILFCAGNSLVVAIDTGFLAVGCNALEGFLREVLGLHNGSGLHGGNCQNEESVEGKSFHTLAK